MQSNRGPFYERHNGAGEDRPAFRNFYFRTTHALLLELDRCEGSASLAIHHVAGHGWPRGALTCVLEALGHYADGATSSSEIHRPLIRSVVFQIDGCALDDAEQLTRAIQPLNAEQTSTTPPALRAYGVEPVALERFGGQALAGHVQLWHVEVD